MTIGSTGLTGSHRASGVEIRHLWAARLDRTALLIRITPSRGRRLGAPARLTGPPDLKGREREQGEERRGEYRSSVHWGILCVVGESGKPRSRGQAVTAP